MPFNALRMAIDTKVLKGGRKRGFILYVGLAVAIKKNIEYNMGIK